MLEIQATNLHDEIFIYLGHLFYEEKITIIERSHLLLTALATPSATFIPVEIIGPTLGIKGASYLTGFHILLPTFLIPLNILLATFLRLSLLVGAGAGVLVIGFRAGFLSIVFNLGLPNSFGT